MNFNGNKVVPAALFAATASIVVSTPAQALDIVGDLGFSTTDLGELVTLTDDMDGTWTLDFGDLTADHCSGTLDIGCATDAFGFNDIGLVGGAGSFSLETAGTVLSTINGKDLELDTFTLDVFDGIDGGNFLISLTGDFSPGGDAFGFGGGGFIGSIEVDGGEIGGVIAEVVPTPAAVMPVLAGLFGAASRKKQEEEA